MKPDDIKKLAELSRIELSPEDLKKMPSEIEAILGYVHSINTVAGTSVESRIESAGVRNVTRPDTVDEFSDTKSLVDFAPESQNGYVKVKKIL